MAGSYRGQGAVPIYGVNLGIFKNHSGGPRGGHISTDRPEFIHMEESGPYVIFPNYNIGEFT